MPDPLVRIFAAYLKFMPRKKLKTTASVVDLTLEDIEIFGPHAPHEGCCGGPWAALNCPLRQAEIACLLAIKNLDDEGE